MAIAYSVLLLFETIVVCQLHKRSSLFIRKSSTKSITMSVHPIHFGLAFFCSFCSMQSDTNSGEYFMDTKITRNILSGLQSAKRYIGNVSLDTSGNDIRLSIWLNAFNGGFWSSSMHSFIFRCMYTYIFAYTYV